MVKRPFKNWANDLLTKKLIFSQNYFSAKPIKIKWEEHFIWKTRLVKTTLDYSYVSILVTKKIIKIKPNK